MHQTPANKPGFTEPGCNFKNAIKIKMSKEVFKDDEAS